MRKPKAQQSDVQMVFASATGRRVLADLDVLFSQRDLHVKGDPYSTAYRTGQHSVVVWLKRQLSVSEPIQNEGDE